MFLLIAKIVTWDNLKILLIIGLSVAVYWFYKDYTFQKAENIRQTENNEQLRKEDSLRYAKQIYTKQELDQYMAYQRQDLIEFLAENKINAKRIERIITQNLQYRDTVSRNQDLSEIMDAIKTKQDARIAIVDSTDCLIIRGFVVFKDDTLSLDITERSFNNITDIVAYWQRRQWKFLGIKTRLFGKKTATVIVQDRCGVTTTKEIVLKK